MIKINYYYYILSISGTRQSIYQELYGPFRVHCTGVILVVTGSLSFECQLVDGRRIRPHQAQLRKREVEVTPPVDRDGLSCGE